MQPQNFNKTLIIALLLLASSLGSMSTDLYVPSLPHLPEIFNTTKSMVQFTLVANLLAFGLAQLALGPLSDRVGRRPVLISGIILFTIFSACCALAPNIGSLITARALQGAAGAAEAVLTLAIITDLFNTRDRVRVLAIYGVLFAFAPAVAPILGGYIHVYGGWQYNFWLLAGLGCVLSFAIWKYMPETNPGKSATRKPQNVLRQYRQLICNPAFLSLSLMMSMICAGLYAYIASAPFIIIDHYGIATEDFGYYQLIVLVFYVAGSYLAAKLVNRVGSQWLLNAGLILLVIGAVLLLLFEYVWGSSLATYMIGISVILFALGPLWAVVPSLAIEQANSGSGLASALFGSLEMMGAGIGVLLLAIIDLPVNQSVSLTFGMLTLAVLGFYFWSRRYIGDSGN
ncbi:MAG: multidrug effflux MFS transporter [Pseudomonadales bacterium]